MTISHGLIWLSGFFLFAVQAPQAIEVTETQKSPYQAEFVAFTGTAVKIQQAGQAREIPLENLMRLRYIPAPAPQPKSDLPIEVELRGGSRVTGSELVSDGKQVSITTVHGPIAFPSKVITACKFRKLSPSLLPQWKSLVESQVAADMLVVVRSDEALDKIEGLIGKITAEAVTFEIDGQSVEAPRTKLAGVKFFSNDAKLGPLAGVVRDVHDNQWIVSSINSSTNTATNTAGRCTLKLTCGESVDLPLAALTEIDLSYGNMRYLADIEPLERTSKPRFELGIELPESSKLFGPRSIASPAKSGIVGPSIEFVGAGAATYRVPNGFTKLVGKVELNPGGQAFIACRAAVMLENKTLWEHTFEATRQPQEISLSVDSDKRLRLIVESQSPQPIGDIITFHQLRFMK